MSIQVECPCGVKFRAARWQLEAGRGKYCSKPCLYKYRVRPTGLTYVVRKENPTSFKKGQRSSPETEFKLGSVPLNKGKPAPNRKYEPGEERQAANARNVSAQRKRKQAQQATRPKPLVCESCGHPPSRTIHFDHDHGTGKFRGWLCHHCNTALGLLRDDPERIKALLNYLERNS